jgi:hypothetical protein
MGFIDAGVGKYFFFLFCYLLCKRSEERGRKVLGKSTDGQTMDQQARQEMQFA